MYPAHAIEEVARRFVMNTIQAAQTEYRLPTLRASGFPWCPLLHASSVPINAVEYKSAYYFRMGTAQHDLLQAYSAAAPNNRSILFGDWRCTACKTVVERSNQPPVCDCPVSDASAAGNRRWEYREIELEYGPLSGHVDTLLQVGPGAWIVLDYKTTELRTPAKRSEFPYRYNVAQVEVYCALLRKVYGLNIVGWCLVYVDRTRPMDGPRSFHAVASNCWGPADHRAMMKIIDWSCRLWPTAQQAFARRMRGERVPPREIQALIDARPCKTPRAYASWMRSKFKYEPGGECPHVGACLHVDPQERTAYWHETLDPAAIGTG